MKKIILSICILSLATLSLSAQKNEPKTEKKQIDKTINFKLKEAGFTTDSVSKPKIYIDGKLFEFDVELINEDKIKSIMVIKGERAKKEYNSPQGVVLIETKVKTDTIKSESNLKDKTEKNKLKSDPLFIVDGKTVDSEMLSKLSPDKIESISVLKDSTAIAIYGSRGRNGVIIVKTKD